MLSRLQEMGRIYLAILFVFVASAVCSLADDQRDFVSKDYGSTVAFSSDPDFSNTVAAKNGYRVFTNTPEYGLKETLKVTYKDGLYVAGEKVVTESEHRRVVNELQNERQSVVGNLRDVNAEILTQLQNLQRQTEFLTTTVESLIGAVSNMSTSAVVVNSTSTDCLNSGIEPVTESVVGNHTYHIPDCVPPTAKYLQHNGTDWVCECEFAWRGPLCKQPPSNYSGYDFFGFGACANAERPNNAAMAAKCQRNNVPFEECVTRCNNDQGCVAFTLWGTTYGVSSCLHHYYVGLDNSDNWYSDCPSRENENNRQQIYKRQHDYGVKSFAMCYVKV